MALFKIVKPKVETKKTSPARKTVDVYQPINKSLNKPIERFFNDLSYTAPQKLFQGRAIYEQFCGKLVGEEGVKNFDKCLDIKSEDLVKIKSIVVYIGSDNIGFNIDTPITSFTEGDTIDLVNCVISRLLIRYKEQQIELSKSTILSSLRSQKHLTLNGVNFKINNNRQEIVFTITTH